MRDQYVFPAIFDYSEGSISVTFPDFPGAAISGATDEEALRLATICLMQLLYSMERSGNRIPEPTQLEAIPLEEGRTQTVVSVAVLMPPTHQAIPQGYPKFAVRRKNLRYARRDILFDESDFVE
ncbi:type II toxin-antitoxin system HicB family antitoxin [Gordoniibacillus kamchatkensis]|uniref:type II toxin-antitoxin system HicB family antitoxin n=1 Tax=Gordoniibacillus kamchatkensis TaxID=1590651 RepID=UPI000AE71CB4|nr:type II toxin-antitoxin system HicB family antitoxin [Paenibacillus sp. VKM B-2647]